jgi:hypothetical protein
MPVPWDALLPLAIIYGILYVGGELVDRTHQWQHNGKVIIVTHENLFSQSPKFGTNGGK